MSSSQAQPPPQQQQVPLTPTYRGMILTTWDALVLYEAALSGVLNHVPRRPHDKERTELIRSGNIFIYEEDTSGIKRWTDGLTWSPSRILTNFLIYREMDQPFTPGEKKKALKKKDQNRINKRTSSSPSPPTPRLGSRSSSIPGVDPEQLRAFVGSLTDSYSFKQGGLVKKTISITYGGVQHHIVSYYSIEDALNNALTTPSNDPQLARIQPRAELITQQSFRSPVEHIHAAGVEMGYEPIMHQPFGTYMAPADHVPGAEFRQHHVGYEPMVPYYNIAPAGHHMQASAADLGHQHGGYETMVQQQQHQYMHSVSHPHHSGADLGLHHGGYDHMPLQYGPAVDPEPALNVQQRAPLPHQIAWGPNHPCNNAGSGDFPTHWEEDDIPVSL